MVLRRAGRPINGSGHCRHLTSALDWHCLGRDDCRDGDRVRATVIDHRLEAIAGPPLAMLTVPNTSSGPLNIGTTEARTLYTIGISSAVSSDTPFANLGGSAPDNNSVNGGQVIRSRPLGQSGGAVHRGQIVGGTTSFLNAMTDWPYGSPLAVCGWWDNNRFYTQAYGGGIVISAAAHNGEMLANPRLRLAPVTVSTNTTPIAALAYRGVHDLTTRTRILAWLMQRYQV